MKFLQLVSLGLATLLAGTTAIPVAKPQHQTGDGDNNLTLRRRAPEPIVTKTDLYKKFYSAGMVEGTTYKFELKWPSDGSTHPDKDIEAARKAVGAKHFAFAAGKITKTERKGTKTKPGTITYDFSGTLYELTKKEGKKTYMSSMSLSSAARYIAGATVTRLGSTKKTDAQLKANANAYITSHPDFEPTTVNCKTFKDNMNNFA